MSPIKEEERPNRLVSINVETVPRQLPQLSSGET